MSRALFLSIPVLLIGIPQPSLAQVALDAAFMTFRAAEVVSDKVSEAGKKDMLRKLVSDAAVANSRSAPAANEPREADIENLFGMPGLARPKADLERSGKNILLIVGDSIDLSGRVFSTAATGAADLTIIANTLNVGDGNARFAMEGRQDGGTLTLVALQGMIGSGVFTVSANGKPGPDRRQECLPPAQTGGSFDVTVNAPASPGGNGGALRLYSAGQAPQLTFSSAAGQPGSGCSGRFITTVTTDTTCRPGHRLPGIPFGIVSPPICKTSTSRSDSASVNTTVAASARDGKVITIGSLVDLADFISLEHIWQWNYGMLQSLEKNVHDAVRRNDQRAIVEIFQHYKNLPALPVPADKIVRQSEILGRINTLRTSVVPPLWFNEIMIQQSGLPSQRQLVLTDGKDVLNRMAPTSALLQVLSTSGKQRWGVLQINPADADKSTIVLSAKLSIDPYIASLVRAELAKNKQRLDGMFSGWTLNAKLEPLLGLDAMQSQVSISGDVLQASMVVSNASSNLLLWRLATNPGLRLTVTWDYVDDSGRKSTGPSFPLFLSLNRRGTGLDIDRAARTMTNRSGSPVLVNYLVRDDQSVVLLAPPLRINSGASEPVPAALADVRTFTVPAEALEHLEAPASLYDLFELNADPSLLKTVVVTNLLPSYDDELHEALRYLEVYVETWDAETAKEKQLRGPYRLSAAGTIGADAKFDLLRFPGRNMVTRVYGKAIYEQGSIRTMKVIESSDLILHVGRAQF